MYGEGAMTGRNVCRLCGLLKKKAGIMCLMRNTRITRRVKCEVFELSPHTHNLAPSNYHVSPLQRVFGRSESETCQRDESCCVGLPEIGLVAKFFFDESYKRWSYDIKVSQFTWRLCRGVV